MSGVRPLSVSSAAAAWPPAPPVTVAERYREVRDLTEELAAPLSAEDQTVQSMPDTSPTKWHRAHTTWFFETFVLGTHDEGYRVQDPAMGYLFNSYYESIGPRHARARRGMITRPSAEEIASYRHAIDEAMDDLIHRDYGPHVQFLVELGLQHEQQHQELLLMDALHLLSENPTAPAYLLGSRATDAPELLVDDAGWFTHPGGITPAGHDGIGFAFDNEGPRHDVLLVPFELAPRPVTCGEWRDFIDDGGYRTPTLWLSDGWATVQAQGWNAPAYWRQHDGAWEVFDLRGQHPIDPARPVSHISYYEADAFARWAGARLPTEFEWEAVASASSTDGNFLDVDALTPRAEGRSENGQLFGDVWEWTSSAYLPYPGFVPEPGAVGEYNGKFMVNQHVLRGGSCLTPPGHVRATYRNFFAPHTRWHCSGLRLAR